MKLREIATDEQKAKLRKIKTLPLSVKAKIYGGNLGGPAMAVQFNSDVRVYSLWEALLYAEDYEKTGGYRAGTAEKALRTALK